MRPSTVAQQRTLGADLWVLQPRISTGENCAFTHVVDCQLFIRRLSCAIAGCFLESNINQTHESVSVAAHHLFVVCMLCLPRFWLCWPVGTYVFHFKAVALRYVANCTSGPDTICLGKQVASPMSFCPIRQTGVQYLNVNL